jgi:ADP-ribose pyrophosphatase YjhB (NUDIX family)
MMPRSGYVAEIRRHVGDRLLVLPSVSICLFDSHDRLLLVRHDDSDVWATPGGTIEPNEPPAQAAVREAREELGVEVVPRDLIGVFGGPGYEVVYDNGDRVAYVTAAFHCEITDGEIQVDGIEVHEARHVPETGWRDLHTPVWLEGFLPHVFAWRRDERGRARFDPPHDD